MDFGEMYDHVDLERGQQEGCARYRRGQSREDSRDQGVDQDAPDRFHLSQHQKGKSRHSKT